jgi:crotonobetainyl-CoA:carnitine CoA-transferase CaiB-like acyl-CoA transferase
VNCFRTADARWLWLQVMRPETCWDRLTEALDAPWLNEDPRFRGGDSALLSRYREPLVELLDEVFRARTLAEWQQRLSANAITWAPVRTLEETVTDETVRASGAFLEFDDEHGVHHVTVNTPCAFDGVSARRATRAPGIGEHTDAVLAAAGFSAAEVQGLRPGGS